MLKVNVKTNERSVNGSEMKCIEWSRNEALIFK